MGTTPWTEPDDGSTAIFARKRRLLSKDERHRFRRLAGAPAIKERILVVTEKSPLEKQND